MEMYFIAGDRISSLVCTELLCDAWVRLSIGTDKRKSNLTLDKCLRADLAQIFTSIYGIFSR